MPAVYEELEPGVGLIRIGEKCFKFGDPWRHQLVAHYKPDKPVELKGFNGRPSRTNRDEIALCLLEQGFAHWCYERYKNGKLVQSPSRPVRLSETFLKEIRMSLQNAHDAAVTHFTKAAAVSGDPQLQALTKSVGDELPKLHAWYLANPTATGAERHAAGLPLIQALDALQAYGMPLQHADLHQDTPQQVAVRHAVASLAPVLKHLADALVSPTGVPPTAV